MMQRSFTLLAGMLALSLILAACAPQAAPAPAPTAPQAEAAQADLGAVKAYAVERAAQMKTATTALRAGAEKYYAAIEQIKTDHPDENPYEVLWANHPAAAKALLDQMRADWFEASTQYELNEGIIAGVPALAYYDAWIDAGAPADEDPEAVDWTLKLADGTVLKSPGNFFHNLTEPALYGTVAEYSGLAVDLNGDGSIGAGEALPEAEILLASVQGLDIATAEMQKAVDAWQPTLEDAFMAMVTMTPTMSEYFEQWKLSSFIAGNDFEMTGFIATSRLFDIKGILHGLEITYANVRPVVSSVDSNLDTQIAAGYTDLTAYVNNLFEKEKNGTHFSPEEADAFGTEAQNKATALAALVAQAAQKANIVLNLNVKGWEPATPPVIEAVAPPPAPIE